MTSSGSRAAAPAPRGSPSRNTNAVNATGARNQNTAGQPQILTSAPPINGPAAEANAKIMVNAATARLRRCSAKHPVTNAGATLITSPAPIPCRTRQNSSHP